MRRMISEILIFISVLWLYIDVPCIICGLLVDATCLRVGPVSAANYRAGPSRGVVRKLRLSS